MFCTLLLVAPENLKIGCILLMNIVKWSRLLNWRFIHSNSIIDYSLIQITALWLFQVSMAMRTLGPVGVQIAR